MRAFYPDKQGGQLKGGRGRDDNEGKIETPLSAPLRQVNRMSRATLVALDPGGLSDEVVDVGGGLEKDENALRRRGCGPNTGRE